jgi:hypothetical protein
MQKKIKQNLQKKPSESVSKSDMIPKTSGTDAEGSLLTFEEVINQTKKPHLLLGNGFSVAYDAKRFSFTTLLASAVASGVIAKDGYVYGVFQKLATADFEGVMRALKDAEKILEVYAGDEEIRKQMQVDSENLKGYLITIITNNHPSKSTDLLDDEKAACSKFLARFDKIYTLNYDLLLYWASLYEPDAAFDGFGNTQNSKDEGYVVYKNSGSFRVHYLHGALHYFDADSEIIKKTYVNTDIPLVEQTRTSLDEGKYPIFVSEGTSEQKMTKIIHNAYLNNCYRSLKNLGGTGKAATGDLVIFGASLKSNDEHILGAILQSNIKNIYCGVSTIKGADNIRTAIESYNDSATDEKKKNLYLYDYKTVNVWGR